MIATTDLTAQIDAHRKVLTEATKECPKQFAIRYGGLSMEMFSYEGSLPPSSYSTQKHPEWCSADCKGTGRIARFPGFRQDKPCNHAGLIDDVGVTWDADKCPRCDGTGWQVRAGGLEDGLAGLDTRQAGDVLEALVHWFGGLSVRTTAPKILTEGLRLVCAEAGLKAQMR